MLLPVTEVGPGAVEGQDFFGGGVGEDVAGVDIDRGEGCAGGRLDGLSFRRSNRRATAERQNQGQREEVC